MVELQEHERRLAATRLPGKQIADPYLARLRREAAEKRGAILVVESDGVFAGFAAGLDHRARPYPGNPGRESLWLSLRYLHPEDGQILRDTACHTIRAAETAFGRPILALEECDGELC